MRLESESEWPASGSAATAQLRAAPYLPGPTHSPRGVTYQLCCMQLYSSARFCLHRAHCTYDHHLISMPATYAVLGATGNCGTALIDNILRVPEAKVNAYCRNRSKLLNKMPHLVDNKRVEIFEGNVQNVDLLARCIQGTRAIFHTVTTNDNIPGCSVGYETSKSILDALRKLKAETPAGMVMPKIILLSSATIDDYLARDMPWWFRPVMLTAASHVYDDLRKAETLLRAEENWVSTVFIKPGGLSVDIQRGHALSLDHEESFISYLDLAAAMIEAADDAEGRFDMKNVSVVNKNGGAKFPPGTPMCILMGLLRHFFPFLHNYLPSTGPS
jgi:putative NADH-flavin reductase